MRRHICQFAVRHAVDLQYGRLLDVMQQDQRVQKQGPDNTLTKLIRTSRLQTYSMSYVYT